MQTRAGVSLVLLVFGLVGVVSAKIYFHEEFDRDWESRWQKTQAKADQQGAFEWTKGKWPLENEMAYGLQTTTDSKFYEISCRLSAPVTTSEKPLAFQYSLRFEQDIECGGGYLKLVGPDYKSEEFGADTPVLVMFGPDVCGGDNKIHLMLDFDGKGKLWGKTPPAPTDHLTHVYTMLLYPNETYEVFVDMVSVGNGTISDDWDVAIPKTIPDPNDKKPDDWDDRMYLDDPASVKPADWVDVETIEDTSATKPEDWDDAKEGEWKPPIIKNPEYKGEWKPKKLYNTNYKGVWTPKQIPNPEYRGSVLKPYTIGGIGIDVWQVRHGTIFDNIMLTDSREEAFAAAKKILDVQVAEEKVFEEKERKEMEQKAAEERAAEAQREKDEENDFSDDVKQDL
eukprot:TRINITY_DN9422_c0_g1_i4.p1 TRINITY_DN9422_c0_g1~~TRINITY_DN9422_c0_g1_i4.p1  ORF type:complete len:396 (-),score=133.81 TRINITY_DN9422_c0_g1_i4:83-1270(-)